MINKKYSSLLLLGAITVSLHAAQTTLNLNEAIQKSLKTTYAKNSVLMKEVAELDRVLIQHIYDPEIILHSNYLSDLSEKGNAFSPDITASEGGVTLKKKFTTGTKASLDTTLSHQVQDFSSFSDVDFKEGFMTLTLEQDLWQNAFGSQDKAVLTQQDLLNKVKNLEIADALEETVYQATLGFWEVVYTEKSMETAKQTLDNAKDIYDLNVRKKKTGLSEERIVLAFKANLQQKQLMYDAAVNSYENAKDNFQTALELSEMPKLDENVEKLLQMVSKAEFTYDWTLQESQLRRYEIAKFIQKHNALAVKIALDKVKPKLSFFGSAGYNGIDDNYGDASKEMFEFKNPKMQAGLQLHFTPGKSPQYGLDRARLEQAIQANDQDILRQQLQLELKSTTRLVKLLKSNLTLSQNTSETLKRKFEEDQQQYDAGRIDVDELLQSEDRYYDANLAALKAKYEFLKAVGRYYRVTNTLTQRIQVMGAIPLKGKS